MAEREKGGAVRSRTVVFFGGGTGGHLAPGLAVASALTARDPAARAVFFTGTRSGEKAFPRADGAVFHAMTLARPRGFPVRFVGQAFTQSHRLRRFLARVKPAACVGLGGYVSLPGVTAAALCGVRVVLLEQNAVAGRVNRLLAPFVSCVCTAFPRTQGLERARRVVCTGNPVRAEFLSPPVQMSGAGSGSRSRHTIAVLGGSQGARVLNETMRFALPALSTLRVNLRVVHAAGADAEDMAREYRRWGVAAQTAPFFEDIAARIAGADFAISRAGGSTLAELFALGIPALLVPYPHARDDHQTANAARAAGEGAAVLCPQGEFGPAQVVDAVRSLWLDRPLWEARAARARALARPRAADDVAGLLLGAVGATLQGGTR